MSRSSSRLWAAASLLALFSGGVAAAQPRPLAGRGLDNLIAFAHLFGYVRYFHPSDQAAAADWEKLALAGVQAIERAGSPEELAAALEGFFRPVAPTVRVFPTARPRPALPAGLEAAAGTEVVYWQHQGLQVGAPTGIYKSERVSCSRLPEGRVLEFVSAAPYRGKRVTVRGAARAEGGPSFLRLAARVGEESSEPVVIAQAASPVTAADWRTYEVSGEVPADAVLLAVDLGLGSGGRVWWDDLSLAVGDGPAEPLLNGGFDLADEDGGPAGWNLEWDVRRAGYRLSLSAERPRSGRYSLLLAAGAPAGPCPRPDEPLAADLGGGVSALVPLALRRDGLGTLPHVPAPAPAEGVPAEPSGNDRATRLADVVLAWNVFQHFYPYFDVVPADWPDELRRALTAAATDADRMAFLATLRRLVVALHDGHGAVSGSFQGAFAHLPLLWEWIEGRLVVTQAAPTGAGGLRPGDVVLTLDGRPAGEAVGAYEEKIPGATPQWRRWTAVSKLALGGPDAAVRITARHPDGVEISATLNHSVPAFGPGSLEETRPAKIVELRPGILYVDLDRIDDDDFQGALDRLAAARGIVFDGRGYPHGLSTVVLQHLATRPVWSARLNVPVVTRPDRQGWQWDSSYRWYLEPKAPHLAGKVAFIADGRVISYAESYLDFVEVYRLGEIVGGPTAGTSGEINPFLLPGGYRMVWTGTQVLKHDGSPHHGVGVQPTVPVARTLQGVAAERDELLEKAIEVVSR